VLECTVVPAGQMYPTWRGPPNGTLYTRQGDRTFNPNLANLARFSWADNNKDLVLINVTRGDEGAYSCLFILPDKPNNVVNIQLNVRSKYTTYTFILYRSVNFATERKYNRHI